jgi:phenylalanyl-tRNA synthetase alpha chain
MLLSMGWGRAGSGALCLKRFFERLEHPSHVFSMNESPMTHQKSDSPPGETVDLHQALLQIQSSSSLEALNGLKSALLGKKGALSQGMARLAQLSPQERKDKGGELNHLKETWAAAFQARKQELEAQALEQRLQGERWDASLPSQGGTLGRLHPVSHTLDVILGIFEKMGLSVRTGPDIEDDFHNFTALNIPALHPARTTHDTFFFSETLEGGGQGLSGRLLRTHTSPVQIRTLRTEPLPLAIVVPGRVFRADYDQTHTPMFHQVEGLVVGQGMHMGHLKGCLEQFLNFFFEKPVPMRFRPSFFPFTEPSAEVDILCDRKGPQLKVGEGSDWLEVLGCGMVHPQVLMNCGVDPHLHQGFAFGMGVERLAMLKYGITDLRHFFENDARWLAHYGFRPTDG